LNGKRKVLGPEGQKDEGNGEEAKIGLNNEKGRCAVYTRTGKEDAIGGNQ